MYKCSIVPWIGTLAIFLACTASGSENEQPLKAIFKDDFHIGAALSVKHVRENETPAMNVLHQHFNSISPENLLKWQSVHPQPNRYNFKEADAFVALGEKLNSFIVGHTLVWHNQTPGWVFADENGVDVNKAPLLETMENHIEQVMGRYKGKIHGWDVVNEAITDDGEFRDSKWYQITGLDFIKRAFIKAADVDPAAELYYNDYNMWKPAKLDLAVEMAKMLKAEGIKVDGIGMQGHLGLEYPTLEQVERSIVKIAEAGMKVMITELDIDLLPNSTGRYGADIDDNFEYDIQYDPYKKGLPEEMEKKLAQRYKELFGLFRKHKDKISRVTFWGIGDQDSWLNNWPIRGRTAYPLVFDREYQIKKEIINQLLSLPQEE